MVFVESMFLRTFNLTCVWIKSAMITARRSQGFAHVWIIIGPHTTARRNHAAYSNDKPTAKKYQIMNGINIWGNT
jgi:hypothetical protein